MANMQTKVIVRVMTPRDLIDVFFIERTSFVYPWPEDKFRRILRDRAVVGLSAEFGGRVIGFVVYRLHSDCVEILDLAVDSSWRREGVGTQIIAKIVERLLLGVRVRLVLRVRESNLDGQRFLRSVGFVAIKVEREHYQADTGEDGYLFQYTLDLDGNA
jgi:ribosomal-protein-alanine N-acetyltransferase